MIRELAIAFTVFWLLMLLATAFGYAVAIALNGMGARTIFKEATACCAAMAGVSLAVAVTH